MTTESFVDSAERASVEAIRIMKKVLMRLNLVEEDSGRDELLTDDEVEQLVDLAWRYQFDKDRSRMKKGLQAMFDHATQRQVEDA